MSEHGSNGSGCILMLIAVIAVIVITLNVMWEMDKRENWIRDLQRRIAVLEQRCQ